MTQHIFQTNRRALLAGLGGLMLPAWAASAKAGEPLSWRLRSKPDALALRANEPATAAWSLEAPGRIFKRGDLAQIAFANDLPVSAVLNWRGLDGVAACEPLLVRPALAQGASDAFQLPLRQAGTYLCDPALLGDGAARPMRALPLIVAESEPVLVDRDEVFLIEGWRLRPDGTAIPPGVDPAGTVPIYTVNGEVMPEIRLRAGERLRIRLINSLQRNVIGVKIEHHEAMVMALDGQPCEPFPARNGALALAPGGRADVFIDAASPAATASILLHDGEAARPIARLIASDEPALRKDALPPAPALPSNGLPLGLDLKTALRVELAFGNGQANWVPPTSFAAASAPAFTARSGRTMVLSLINRAATTAVFHLHGHHFRLLDRLDDGWKPFWLDTIAIDAGQTQRIAFAAEHAGRWLIEAAETRWEAARFVRWFGVT
jgi:FtsP/CotA-like multicopper oxidase with cupredoxin domain